MHDRPNADELIASVTAFLEQEVLPTIGDARLRFRGLIAANLLQIVARELAAGLAPHTAEHARLLELFGEPAQQPHDPATLQAELARLNHALVEQIRAGGFDAPTRFQAAYEHAEASVIAKLRISNPRYVARVAPSASDT